MAKLSVVLIVKNEQSNLDACLKTAQFADEIIVLDSNSTDDTITIAKQHKAHVYHNKQWLGYGVARQQAQNHATGDWILMLDADERISQTLSKQIKKIVQQDQRKNVYALARLSICFGREIRHCGWYPDWVVRLYHKDNGKWNDALVHEKLIHQGEIKQLSGHLRHYTYQNIHHYLIKSANYANDWANEKNKQGKVVTLTQGYLHALACFAKMYLFKRGFLDGKAGFLLSTLSAHSTFAKYAALWDKNNV